MTLPTYIGTGAANQTITNVAIAYHASTAVDDIVVLQVESSAAATTVATPTGYTALTTSSTGVSTDETRCSVFWKRMVAADITAGSITVTNPSNHIAAACHTFRGAPLTGSPFGTPTALANTTSTAMTGTGVTTTTTDSLVLYMSTIGNGGATFTWTGDATSSGATWTMQYNVRANSAGDGGALALNTAPVTAPGTATGNVTQHIGVTDPAANVVVELKSGALAPAATVATTPVVTAYGAAVDFGVNASVATTPVVTAYDAQAASGPSASVATTPVVTAYDAKVTTSFTAEVVNVSVSVGNAVGYHGAPLARQWRIPAEDRTWRIEAEDRTWTIPSED